MQIYTDWKGNVPTASVCARTLFLPAYTGQAGRFDEETFASKFTLALEDHRAGSRQEGGAQMGYE